MTSTGPAPSLRTERLLLRQWREDDFAPFAALNADPIAMEHMPALLDKTESDAMARRIHAGLEEHPYGLWAVEVVGDAGQPGSQWSTCVSTWYSE